jgi:hypothetical protein
VRTLRVTPVRRDTSDENRCSKGIQLKKLPQIFRKYENLLVTTWGHDPGGAYCVKHSVHTAWCTLPLYSSGPGECCIFRGGGWSNSTFAIWTRPFQKWLWPRITSLDIASCTP